MASVLLAACGATSVRPAVGAESALVHSASPRATPASGATIMIHVAPVGTHGRLTTGFTVSQTVRGMCDSGSDVVRGRLYRCFIDNEVADPCWGVAAQKGAVVDALCLPDPWLTAVTQVVTAGLPKATGAISRDSDVPWAVELTIGVRCIALQGGRAGYRGGLLNFVCGDGLELVGSPDRNEPLWTYQTARLEGAQYVSGPTVGVGVAWFAGMGG